MAKEEANKKIEKRPQALKRDLQNGRRRARNRVMKSRIRSALRSFETSIESKDVNASKEQLNVMFSLVDKAAKQGFYKRNKANRTKSRLTARLVAIAN